MVTRLKYGDGEVVIGEHGETVGRIVHVLSAFGGTAEAGVIVAVSATPGRALVYLPEAHERPDWLPFSPTYKLGHWTWPPRIVRGVRDGLVDTEGARVVFGVTGAWKIEEP